MERAFVDQKPQILGVWTPQGKILTTNTEAQKAADDIFKIYLRKEYWIILREVAQAPTVQKLVICSYVYTCIHIYTYSHMYMHMCIYIRTCIYTQMYTYIYIYIYLFIYLFIYICMYVPNTSHYSLHGAFEAQGTRARDLTEAGRTSSSCGFPMPGPSCGGFEAGAYTSRKAYPPHGVVHTADDKNPDVMCQN